MIKTVFVILCALPCFYLSLRRALHLYQLESYFSAGYLRSLKAHRKRLLGPKTVFPLALYLAAALFLPPLCFFGAGLFVLINLPQKMKKPLVFTARIKRLTVTSCLLSAALCATAFFPGRPVFFTVITLVLLFTPWLLVLWGSVNAPLEKAVSQHYVNDARRILRSHTGLKTVGITGSYGKTSTKYFLHAILSTKYNVYMTPGNFNTTLGVTRAVREGLKPYHEIFLCEMGARHLGDVREICELVQPDMGIITSVGPQHLESFGSVENVLRGKLELYDAVRQKGAVLLNTDSRPLADALPSLSGKRIVTCGKTGGYRASDLSVTADGTVFTVTTPDGARQTFETSLLGEANVQNLTCAIACAHILGLSLDEMKPAVRALKSVPHRLQLINRGGLSLIDDAYNSNPEGARVALDTLSLFGGCRILVTPGLVELGAQEYTQNELLGEYAASRCDRAVLVGKTNADPLRAGLLKAGFDGTRIFEAKTISEAFDFVRSVREEKKLALLLNDLPDNYT